MAEVGAHGEGAGSIVPYFNRTGTATFKPTEHVRGAWNPREQHIAPALGLMAHLVETDRAQRRTDAMLITRLSYDILGTLPVEEVEVTVRVTRPGRSIDLVEAVLSHRARPAVVLRAWLLQTRDTTPLAATGLPPLPPPGHMAEWDPSTVWPGGFIASARVRRTQPEPGRAAFWVRSDVPLLDEPVSPTARAAGWLDIANGMTVRASPRQVAFPNVDLTAHLFRRPEGEWLGFDTTVSFGPSGHGVTSSVVHDTAGPIGTVAQSLTVRPVGVSSS